MWMYAAPVGAFLVSAFALIALLPLLRTRVLDVPNHRSSHAAPVPRGGGVGVALGTVGGLVGARLFDTASTPPWQVLLALCLLAAMGLADDLRSMGVGVRLLGQAVSALVLLTAFTFHPLVFAVLVVFAIGYVNSTNFMDGINGITAGSCVALSAWFALVGHLLGAPTITAAGLAVAGATFAFGLWNVRGVVFLGDVGSYFLGGVIAWMAIAVWAEGAPWFVAFAPLALVVLDTVWTLIRRVRDGKRVGEPHREHIYQLLAAGGWGHLPTAGYFTVLTLVLTGLALGAWRTSGAVQVAIVSTGVLLTVVYLITPRFALTRLGTENDVV